jgi:hypothetical protein
MQRGAIRLACGAQCQEVYRDALPGDNSVISIDIEFTFHSEKDEEVRQKKRSEERFYAMQKG